MLDDQYLIICMMVYNLFLLNIRRWRFCFYSISHFCGTSKGSTIWLAYDSVFILMAMYLNFLVYLPNKYSGLCLWDNLFLYKFVLESLYNYNIRFLRCVPKLKYRKILNEKNHWIITLGNVYSSSFYKILCR